MDKNVDGRRLTYAELAQLRRIDKPSALKLAIGNHYDLCSDVGPLRDEALIVNAMDKMFPDDDAAQESIETMWLQNSPIYSTTRTLGQLLWNWPKH